MLKKILLNPIRVPYMMKSKELKDFPTDSSMENSKEILRMEINAKENPIQLSQHHHILPTVLPHTYAWNKLYGRKHVAGKEIDLFQEFKVLRSETISRAAFGSTYLEGHHIFRMLTRMAVIISRNRFNIRLPIIGKLVRSEDDIESDRMKQEIQKSVMNMINKREEKALMGDSDHKFGNDFLGLLLKAHHESDVSKKISVDILIDECKNFYLAGQETTASSLTWTAFLLAIRTDWQDKAREEVLQLFGHNINPSADSLTKFKMMNLIINEALWLYPPAVVVPPRNTKREVRSLNFIGSTLSFTV